MATRNLSSSVRTLVYLYTFREIQFYDESSLKIYRCVPCTYWHLPGPYLSQTVMKNFDFFSGENMHKIKLFWIVTEDLRLHDEKVQRIWGSYIRRKNINIHLGWQMYPGLIFIFNFIKETMRKFIGFHELESRFFFIFVDICLLRKYSVYFEDIWNACTRIHDM